MNRLLLALVSALVLMASVAKAQDMPMMPKHDDRVVFDLSEENWVTTKTARVTVTVEAAVSGNTAGTMRADMTKSVDDLAKGEWRLTAFNRSQDQTGLERWSAGFEARLPENELNGLNDNAKKLSKAGMQLTVNSIDFSPTLDEWEAARSAVRTQIYKSASDQLTALNAALPGRNYRIASIDFTNEGDAPVARPLMRPRVMAMAAVASAPDSSEEPMERSEKITMTARVTLAATPPAPGPDLKH